MSKYIQSPAINSIVCLQNKRDVLIVKGSYMGSHNRVSNFWYWREVFDDGSLGEEEHGYGSFTESVNEYQVQVTVIVKRK